MTEVLTYSSAPNYLLQSQSRWKVYSTLPEVHHTRRPIPHETRPRHAVEHAADMAAHEFRSINAAGQPSIASIFMYVDDEQHISSLGDPPTYIFCIPPRQKKAIDSHVTTSSLSLSVLMVSSSSSIIPPSSLDRGYSQILSYLFYRARIPCIIWTLGQHNRFFRLFYSTSFFNEIS